MSETTLKQPMAINEFLVAPSPALPATPDLKSNAGARQRHERGTQTRRAFLRPCAREDKQDDHSSFATPGDLNNFLIRRQLLGMEARRIQELLREAEAELKAKQDHLVDVRDRVLAALRIILIFRMNWPGSKVLEGSSWRICHRTVERYIRRRAKRLFAYLKPRASTTMTDRPAATSRPRPWLASAEGSTT